MNENIDKETKEKIINLISALMPKVKIILFGSRARGTHGKWSDIDIALDAGKILPVADVDEIKSIFKGTNIPYKIEIVDFHSVSKDMQSAIKNEGVIWKS